jgi:hypothetical protein
LDVHGVTGTFRRGDEETDVATIFDDFGSRKKNSEPIGRGDGLD